MEFGTIEREIYVEARPEIVFEVVSSPDHLKQWWPDDARYEPTPGSTGEIVFGDRDAGGAGGGVHRRRRATAADVLLPLDAPGDEVRGGGQLAAGHLRPDPVGRGNPAQDDRDRLPRDGLGGRRPRAAVPRARHRLGLLPAAAGTVRRDAAGAAHERAVVENGSTTSSGPRSATRPGAGCSTCCWSTATAPRPRWASSCRSPGRRWPSTSACSTGSAWSGRRRRAGRSATGWTTPSSPAPVAQLSSVGSAWDARLQRIKRIAEAIQRTQQILDQTTSDKRPRRHRDGGHSAQVGVKNATPEKVYDALTTVEGLAGWWTDDTKGSGGRRRRAGVPVPAVGGFDMEVVELQPSERVAWRVVDGPEEWIGYDDRLGPPPGRRLHDRAVQAPGLEGAGGVHAPLQHQVGLVPDEPEVAGGDRRGRTRAAGRADQRLALSYAVLGWPITRRPAGTALPAPRSAPRRRPRRRFPCPVGRTSGHSTRPRRRRSSRWCRR